MITWKQQAQNIMATFEHMPDIGYELAIKMIQAITHADDQPISWQMRVYHDQNTSTPGWSDWKEVTARYAHTTVADRVSEIKGYIEQGKPYELRALYASPVHNTIADDVAVMDAAEQLAEEYSGDTRPCIQTDVMNAFYAGCKFASQQLPPVEGDVLPPINSRVLIHLNSSDSWVPHTVVGYYVWPDRNGSTSLHRVNVRVRSDDGYLNARMLSDIRPMPSTPPGAVQSTAGSPGELSEDQIFQMALKYGPLRTDKVCTIAETLVSFAHAVREHTLKTYGINTHNETEEASR